MRRLTRWSLAALAVSWLAFVPVTARVFNTTLYSDDFNHNFLLDANGTTLDNGVGGSETVTWVGPALSFTLGSSTLFAGAASPAQVLTTSGGSNPSHVKACAKNLANAGSGVIIFWTGTISGGTGYLYYRDTSTTGIYKNAVTLLGSAGGPASDGDVMCLEGDGVNLIGTINGVNDIVTTDSTYTTGNQGFLTVINTGATQPTWTNFTVESVGSAPAFPAAIINAPIICCKDPWRLAQERSLTMLHHAR